MFNVEFCAKQVIVFNKICFFFTIYKKFPSLAAVCLSLCCTANIAIADKYLSGCI